MIIDTSATVAIPYGEPEAVLFTRLIHESATSRISVANYLELSMVIEKQLGSEGMRQADAFFRRAAIDIEPVTVEQGHLARQAFLDFGKGRHKAGLNFGDCFATLSPGSSTSRCYSRVTTSQRQTSVRLHDTRPETMSRLKDNDVTVLAPRDIVDMKRGKLVAPGSQIREQDR